MLKKAPKDVAPAYRNAALKGQGEAARYEDRTHDLRIMGPTRYQLRQPRTSIVLSCMKSGCVANQGTIPVRGVRARLRRRRGSFSCMSHNGLMLSMQASGFQSADAEKHNFWFVYNHRSGRQRRLSKRQMGVMHCSKAGLAGSLIVAHSVQRRVHRH